MLIDRESLYRIFYGDRPPPPPWATDCPIRFDVWLAFAEQVRTVDVRTAAQALGTTQAALRERLPADFPGAVKTGRTWRIPLPSVRAEGGKVSTDTPTLADLTGHSRVDVILAVSDDFGPERVLEWLRGIGGLKPVSHLANPIAAGGYIAVLVTFAELIQTIIPLTNLGRKIRSAQSLGPIGPQASTRRTPIRPTGSRRARPVVGSDARPKDLGDEADRAASRRASHPLAPGSCGYWRRSSARTRPLSNRSRG